jgi:two-component system OmpR family response regulator
MLTGDQAEKDYARFRQTPEFGGSDAEARLLAICSQRSVLVMEDEPVLAGRMVSAFEGAGFKKPVHANTGRRALSEASKARFDVIVLDRDNPDMEGLEVSARIRALPQSSTNSAASPIIIVTMLGSLEDRIKARLTGAHFNDYITKANANWEELLARVAAQIDIHSHLRNNSLSSGLLKIDPGARTIDFDGIDLPLRSRSFDIMLELIRANGRPVTRHMLWESCWNRSMDHETMVNIVNVAISDIRKRIKQRLEQHNATASTAERVSDALLAPEAFLYSVWSRGLAVRTVLSRQ